MKICVYAICKNESKFIDRWFNSMKEADYVCVLDTGSTDDSYEKLQKLNLISSQKKYSSFRFDTARNDSMALIPTDTDICVCTDLDEVFVAGWSKTLKEAWKKTTTQARYRYTWSFNPDGSEGIVFMADKIHKNNCFKWINPVHEILTPKANLTQEIISLPQLQLNHFADSTKSRSNYLPLLELSVKENPLDDRNTHYLGREYMFHGEYDKAIKTLSRHLKLKSANWNLERSASHRYIANCYKFKNQKHKQEKHLLLAVLEASETREALFDLAVFYFENHQYIKSAIHFEQMLKIQNRELNYMSSPLCWGSTPYDCLSICYYHLGDVNKAISNAKIALQITPNERIKNNLNLFLKNS